MIRMGLALFVLAIAGCATTEQPRLVFEKPGTPEAQMQRDQRACLRSSVAADDMVLSNVLKLDREAYIRCMQTRGYILRT